MTDILYAILTVFAVVAIVWSLVELRRIRRG